jgi:hypothetical protein
MSSIQISVAQTSVWWLCPIPDIKGRPGVALDEGQRRRVPRTFWGHVIHGPGHRTGFLHCSFLYLAHFFCSLCWPEKEIQLELDASILGVHTGPLTLQGLASLPASEGTVETTADHSNWPHQLPTTADQNRWLRLFTTIFYLCLKTRGLKMTRVNDKFRWFFKISLVGVCRRVPQIDKVLSFKILNNYDTHVS